MNSLNHRLTHLNEGFWLGLASLWCLLLLVARMEWSGKPYFLFLVWNLFLAWIPWFISRFALSRMSWKHPLKWVSAGMWLLFFPNAPYILTDLVHLKQRAEVPFWLDLLLILSFAFAGLWLGLASLRHLWEEVRLVPTIRFLLFSGICVLSAFGVYLGRYLRWNSWEVFSDPLPLLSDLMIWIHEPSALKEPLAFSLGFGFLLWMMFWLARGREWRSASGGGEETPIRG